MRKKTASVVPFLFTHHILRCALRVCFAAVSGPSMASGSRGFPTLLSLRRTLLAALNTANTTGCEVPLRESSLQTAGFTGGTLTGTTVAIIMKDKGLLSKGNYILKIENTRAQALPESSIFLKRERFMILAHTVRSQRFFLALLLFFLTVIKVYSFQTSSIDLVMPSTLTAPFIIAHFEHRFYGSIVDTPVQTQLLGLGSGAKVQIGAEAKVWKGLSLSGQYYFTEREIALYAGYNQAFLKDMFNSSLWLGWYNYGAVTRTSSYFAIGAFSMPLVLKRFTPVLNLAWDGETNKPGFGAGLTANIIEPLDISFDYIPVVTGKTSPVTPLPVYSAGITIKTYHHQFFLFVSNSSTPNTHRTFRGADDYNPRIGFIINRLFDF
jgi:hypothetical protein